VTLRPSTPNYGYCPRAWRVARVPGEQIPSTELIHQLLDERSNAATTAGC
jgi:hypothetical protein